MVKLIKTLAWRAVGRGFLLPLAYCGAPLGPIRLRLLRHVASLLPLKRKIVCSANKASRNSPSCKTCKPIITNWKTNSFSRRSSWPRLDQQIAGLIANGWPQCRQNCSDGNGNRLAHQLKHATCESLAPLSNLAIRHDHGRRETRFRRAIRSRQRAELKDDAQQMLTEFAHILRARRNLAT